MTLGDDEKLYSKGGALHKTYLKLVAQGLTPAQASGVLGNIVTKGGGKIDPNLDINGALGIAGWSGSRRDALLEYAGNGGSGVKELDTQINFLVKELNGVGDSWADAKTRDKFLQKDLDVSSAANMYNIGFERSPERLGDPLTSEMATSRINNAIKVFNNFNTPDTGATADGAGRDSFITRASILASNVAREKAVASNYGEEHAQSA